MSRNKQPKQPTIHNQKKSLDSIKELMQKAPARAYSELLRHMELYPNDMYAWHYYGKLNKEFGSIDEAIKAFTKVAESDSWNRYAGVVGLGDIARNEGKRETAKKYYYQAIRENPNEIEHTYCVLARTEAIDGNYAAAIDVLNMCKKQSNNILIEKLRVYISAGNIEQAENLIARIIPQTIEEKRTIAYQRALLAIQTGNQEAAQQFLTTAKLYPAKKDYEYYRILNTEALLAIDLNDPTTAIVNCEEALNAGVSHHGEITTTLGRAKQNQGEYKEALKYFYEAIQEVGVASITKQAAYYYASLIEMSFGNIEKAKQNLTECLSIDTEPYTSVVETLCGIHYRQGNYEEIDQIIAKYKGQTESPKLISSLKFMEILLKKQRKEPLPNKNECTYREKQAVNYSKEAAIAHIKERHMEAAESVSKFAADVDIEQLYEEALLQLNDSTMVASDMVDKYVIPYPGVGHTTNGEIIDEVGVITLPGTFEIITMYPECDKATIRKSDVERFQARESQRQNESSRVAKFNKKFANFTPPKK